MMFNVSLTFFFNIIFHLSRVELSLFLFQIILISISCFQKELITAGTLILIKLWNHVDKKSSIKILSRRDLIRNWAKHTKINWRICLTRYETLLLTQLHNNKLLLRLIVILLRKLWAERLPRHTWAQEYLQNLLDRVQKRSLRNLRRLNNYSF